MRTIIIITLVIKREGGWTSLGIRKINHVKATFYPNSVWESPEWRDNSGSGGKRLIGTVWSVSSGSTKIMSIISASEIAKRIGVSRAVLYKWKDEIIGNSAYQTMRKHNEPSLEAERDALREEVARLNQEIRRRQMELDILKKAEEIIKKAPGISISHLNNREKTKITDALRQTYPLTELLRVLGLDRSSYFITVLR